MDNEYVLGRGKLFFDRFADNTKVSINGERRLGNCPSLAYTSAVDSLDHYNSEGGQKTKDASADLQKNTTGSFGCDNISSENVALFVGGSVSSLAQTAATGLTENIKLSKDRWYQLGKTTGNPSGLRNLASLVVTATVGGATYSATNYDVNYETGRVYVHPDATLVEGTEYTFTYNTVASSRKRVASGTKSIYGALRFVADNAEGTDRDHYFPYVKLTPNGDFNLIGDEWSIAQFNLEILRLNDTTEAIYIDERGTITV
jgi:hypothetical protein